MNGSVPIFPSKNSLFTFSNSKFVTNDSLPKIYEVHSYKGQFYCQVFWGAHRAETEGPWEHWSSVIDFIIGEYVQSMKNDAAKRKTKNQDRNGPERF